MFEHRLEELQITLKVRRTGATFFVFEALEDVGVLDHTVLTRFANILRHVLVRPLGPRSFFRVATNSRFVSHR